MNSADTKSKNLASVRNLLKVLEVLCVVFVFCPSFMVSCGGGVNEVNVMIAVRGVQSYGKTVVNPHPLMLLCLLFPVISLVLLFIKKVVDYKLTRIIALITAIDLIMWIAFRAVTKDIAEENLYKFKTTGWYVFNIICLILILLFSCLVLFGLLKLDGGILSFSNIDKSKTIDQMSETVSRMSGAVTQMANSATSSIGSRIVNKDGVTGFCPCCGISITLGQKLDEKEVIGYCSKCGSALSIKNKYCSSCGFPVPESMIAEAEEKMKELERQREEEKIAEEQRRLAEEQQRIEREKKALEEQEQQKLQQGTNTENNSSHQATIFCPYCGTEQEGDSVFCSACGKKID